MTTIRDVVIRVAIEQKEASLKMPSVSPIETANVGVAKSAEAAAKAAEQEYDKIAQEAQSAYSRIMKSREAAEKAAERQYEKEAQEALSAYSRIMKAKADAEKKEQDLVKQTAAARSELLGVYAQTAGAAMQLAKGVAFVAASSEEEADAFVKSIAAVQGYYDAAVGTVQVVKSIGDLQRKAAAYTELATAATAKNTAATTASAVATTAAKVSLSSMFLVAGGVTAAVGLAYLAWRQFGQSQQEATAKIDSTTNSLKAQASIANQAADAYRAMSEIRLSSASQGDTSLYEQELTLLGKAQARHGSEAWRLREKTDRQAGTLEGKRQRGQATQADVDTEVSKGIAANLEMQEKQVEMIRQEIGLRGQIRGQLENQRSVAQNYVQDAAKALQIEQQRYSSALQSVGQMTALEKMRARRIQDQVDKGQDLSRSDLEFVSSRSFLKSHGAAIAQFEREGAKDSGLVNSQPLEAARAQQQQAQKLWGNEIDNLTKQIDAKAKEEEAAMQRLMRLFGDIAGQKSRLAELADRLESVDKKVDRTSVKGRN